MDVRLTIVISETEGIALRALAKAERRNSRDQAAILIREMLQERGLLQNIHQANFGQPCRDEGDQLSEISNGR